MSLTRVVVLVIPWLYCAETVWLFAAGQRQKAIRRAAIAIAGFIFVALAALTDKLVQTQGLQLGELAAIAYAIVSIAIIARCAWDWGWKTAKRITGITTQKRQYRSMLLRVVSLLIFASLLNAFILSFLETHWPKQKPPNTPKLLRLPFTSLSWKSTDGTTIAGWFVPCDESDITIVVCHGVGAYQADMLEFVSSLHEGGFNVLTLDFRGHGQSGGHTVTYGKQEKYDIISGIDMLRVNYPTHCKHVAGVGWSMGASSLVLAAAIDRRIEALHLDAPYAWTFDIAKVICDPLPPGFQQIGLYVGTAFGSLETGTNLFAAGPGNVIGSISPRPIMFVHGDEDRLVPIEQGRILFQASGKPKEWHVVSGAGHCETLAAQTPAYQQRMVAFLRDALRAQQALAPEYDRSSD